MRGLKEGVDVYFVNLRDLNVHKGTVRERCGSGWQVTEGLATRKYPACDLHPTAAEAAAAYLPRLLRQHGGLSSDADRLRNAIERLRELTEEKLL